MKKCILFLLLLLFTCLPADARHLAVFTLDEFSAGGWRELHPDVLVIGKDWRYLDEFLKKTQDKFNSDDEELVIDIDCHGGPESGALFLNGGQKTSMGSVIKRIQDFFPNRPNMVVITEACYAGRCYKLTGRGGDGALPGGVTEYPSFPVLGMPPDYANFGMLQYLQYEHHIDLFQEDIRQEAGRNVKPYKKIGFFELLFHLEDKVYTQIENLFKLLYKLDTGKDL